MNEQTRKQILRAGHDTRKAIKTMDSAISTGANLTRTDGWSNLFTGVGTNLDKRTQTVFACAPRLGWGQLDELYIGDGIARRIIDLPTKEMTRKGYEIVGDADGKLLSAMKKKNLIPATRELLRWSKLYGGALGVLEIDDGAAQPTAPVRENRIRAVHGMHVYNRWRTWWTPSDLYQDPANPKYMTPQWYTVSPILSTPFRVHESRTVRMDGLPVPDVVRVRNLGWGDSVIQAVYDKLRAMFAVYADAESIIDDFVTSVMSVKNLSNLLQSDAGTKVVKDRINILDMSKHILNTLLMDADLETFQKHASSVAGLPDLLDRYAGVVSAVTGMPQTILMGRSPGGLNATGDADFQGWYDQLAADQEDMMNPAIQRLVHLMSIAQETRTALPENWAIQHKPLWQLSETDEAKRRLTIAQADALYAKMGLTAGEIIQSRFGGGHYSIEVKLDPTINPEDRVIVAPPAPGKTDPDGDPADDKPDAKPTKEVP